MSGWWLSPTLQQRSLSIGMSIPNRWKHKHKHVPNQLFFLIVLSFWIWMLMGDPVIACWLIRLQVESSSKQIPHDAAGALRSTLRTSHRLTFENWGYCCGNFCGSRDAGACNINLLVKSFNNLKPSKNVPNILEDRDTGGTSMTN